MILLNTRLSVIVGFVLLAISLPVSSDAWLLYHKSSFKGKVIDAETNQPIEGAVVVAIYNKRIFRFIQSGEEAIEVKEVLTDSSGTFHIPSYTTFTNPIDSSSYVCFKIFKPGYGRHYINNKGMILHLALPDEEKFFSYHDFGKNNELLFLLMDKEHNADFRKIQIEFGIVELPRLKTIEERKKNLIYNIYSAIIFPFLEKQTVFLKLLNAEEENIGLQRIDQFKAREAIYRMNKSSGKVNPQ